MKRVLIAVFALLFLAGGPREKPRPIVVPPMTGAEEFTTMRHLVKQLNDAFDAIYEGVRSRPEVYYGQQLLSTDSQCDTVIITGFDGEVKHYKCDTCFVPIIAHMGVETSSLPAIQKADTLTLGATSVVSYRLPTMLSDSSFLVCIGAIGGTTYQITWVTVGR